MANSIANLKTPMMKNASGEAVPILIMGLTLDDVTTLNTFIQHAVTQFRNQRMISPPQTATMLVTLIGTVTVEQFLPIWRKHVDADPGAKVFMGLMKKADLLHGSKDGKTILGQASLLDTNV